MRIAFVTPRYGADIAAGPEHACRLLAEQVSRRHDVDVLTTCARDARTWKNVYPEGADRVRGVQVRRFATAAPHDPQAFADINRQIVDSPRARADELEWVRRRGPAAPGLIEYLVRQHRSYDALVFHSLEHLTTAEGIRVAPDRSVIVPYLRPRPSLRFSLWREIVESIAGVGFISSTERLWMRRYLGAEPRAEEVVGIGIDPPPQLAYPRHQQDPADSLVPDDEGAGDSPEPIESGYLSSRGVTFRRRNRLYDSFALYCGRVEPDNGCTEMLEYFSGRQAGPDGMPLVLMGVKLMKVPDLPGVTLGGVIPDRERMAAYEAAELTIAPASDDLLAQTALESLAVGTPVLVNASNTAAVEHCRASNGGLYYANREEFTDAFALLASDTRLRGVLGQNGRNYVRQHFRWDDVIGRFDRLVSKARSSR
jgi:glycosyltransferase involved in cell wall biosynthesis